MPVIMDGAGNPWYRQPPTMAATMHDAGNHRWYRQSWTMPAMPAITHGASRWQQSSTIAVIDQDQGPREGLFIFDYIITDSNDKKWMHELKGMNVHMIAINECMEIMVMKGVSPGARKVLVQINGGVHTDQWRALVQINGGSPER